MFYISYTRNLCRNSSSVYLHITICTYINTIIYGYNNIHIYIRHPVILYAQNLDMQVFGFYIFTYNDICIYKYNNIRILKYIYIRCSIFRIHETYVGIRVLYIYI